MYSNAKLFTMASDPNTVRELFLANVTLSISDDTDDCVDMDAEKARLNRIWDVAHMTIKDIVQATNMSQTAFANEACIPIRTVQDWCGERRTCPLHVRFLLAEHYGLL